ncbi:hypothetical protein ACC741_38655, partial [Rhizobium johnstonii]
WKVGPRPELWFCYHPYYKSPDPFVPAISAEFAIPYVTAEASYAEFGSDVDLMPAKIQRPDQQPRHQPVARRHRMVRRF